MFHIPAHRSGTAAQFDAGFAAVNRAIAVPSYEVYDHRTGKRVGQPYRSVIGARRRRDYLDSEYGAVRFGVRLIAA